MPFSLCLYLLWFLPQFAQKFVQKKVYSRVVGSVIYLTFAKNSKFQAATVKLFFKLKTSSFQDHLPYYQAVTTPQN